MESRTIVSGSSTTIVTFETTVSAMLQTGGGITQITADSQMSTPARSVPLRSSAQTTLVESGSSSAYGSTVELPLTFGGVTISSNTQSQLVIGGQTVAPGRPVTVGSSASTTVVAVSTNSAGQSVVVVGTASTTLPTLPQVSAPTGVAGSSGATVALPAATANVASSRGRMKSWLDEVDGMWVTALGLGVAIAAAVL